MEAVKSIKWNAKRPHINPLLTTLDIAELLSVSEKDAEIILRNDPEAPRMLFGCKPIDGGPTIPPRYNPIRAMPWAEAFDKRSIRKYLFESNVYLLLHKSHPRFKIGKANDVVERASKLAIINDIHANSIIVRCRTQKDAFKLEKCLHFIFCESRKREDALSTSGFTEWFDKRVFNEAVRMSRKICGQNERFSIVSYEDYREKHRYQD